MDLEATITFDHDEVRADFGRAGGTAVVGDFSESGNLDQAIAGARVGGEEGAQTACVRGEELSADHVRMVSWCSVQRRRYCWDT
ncbi:hypothetical protein GCM10008949_44310 [Deinococcus humi]|nr:hypothetical protein GCM10008949_44310 [Deinococcus humi]